MSESRWKTAEERLREQLVALEAENATLKQRLDGAAQIIAMRTADVATLKQEHLKRDLARDKMQVRIDELRGECDRLRQALQPFAGMAVGWPDHTPDMHGCTVAVGDLRRAALALSPSETEEGDDPTLAADKASLWHV